MTIHNINICFRQLCFFPTSLAPLISFYERIYFIFLIKIVWCSHYFQCSYVISFDFILHFHWLCALFEMFSVMCQKQVESDLSKLHHNVQFYIRTSVQSVLHRLSDVLVTPTFRREVNSFRVQSSTHSISAIKGVNKRDCRIKRRSADWPEYMFAKLVFTNIQWAAASQSFVCSF